MTEQDTSYLCENCDTYGTIKVKGGTILVSPCACVKEDTNA
jgi:hypothetical protein